MISTITTPSGLHFDDPVSHDFFGGLLLSNQATTADMERSTSTATSSGRSFISRALARHDAGSEPSEDVKGPFGLNTLFNPGDSAIADLVFVHGLGGGSRSTWTKSGDPALYWPKEWLPQDPDFQDVRIHSFGYNSNWGHESVLSVHDFSKSLLVSLRHCPVMPRDASVRTTCSTIEYDQYGLIRQLS